VGEDAGEDEGEDDDDDEGQDEDEDYGEGEGAIFRYFSFPQFYGRHFYFD
jgi:hypothetical protein